MSILGSRSRTTILTLLGALHSAGDMAQPSEDLQQELQELYGFLSPEYANSATNARHVYLG